MGGKYKSQMKNGKKKWKALSGAAARTGKYKLIRNKKILVNRIQENGWGPQKARIKNTGN